MIAIAIFDSLFLADPGSESSSAEEGCTGSVPTGLGVPSPLKGTPEWISML